LIVTVLTTVTKTIFRGENVTASHSEYAVCDWNDNAAAMEVEVMATKGLMEKGEGGDGQEVEGRLL
jgi:hypothetical protein